MTHSAETLRPEKLPIQTEAIERVRRLGQTPEGESVLALVIADFHEEAQRWSGEIRSRLAGGDLVAIGRIAHTLRGSAASFGATRLVEMCGELETFANGGNVEGCRSLLPSLDEALTDVRSALSNLE